MEILPLSKNHEKWIRKLHQKKYRDEEGVFIAEGFNSFEAAMKITRHAVKEVVIEKSIPESALKNLPDNLPVYTCTKKVMETISTEESPQGIVIVCYQGDFRFTDLENGSPGQTLLYLENISDPGNLGTILRTATWFGIREILLSPFSVDPFNTKVIRASAGTIFSREIYLSVERTDLFRFAERHDYNLIATVPRDGVPIGNWQSAGKNIILFGPEAQGLSEEFAEKAHQRISIPGKGDAESLNLAAAVAIILYEVSAREP
ncbi:MAG: RNA methyltransferase [Thermodesulfobacteriota bacterium]|nr:RNA methyltransferase [Thermodesulfobacteriota bacterium]